MLPDSVAEVLAQLSRCCCGFGRTILSDSSLHRSASGCKCHGGIRETVSLYVRPLTLFLTPSNIAWVYYMAGYAEFFGIRYSNVNRVCCARKGVAWGMLKRDTWAV